jgi:Tol biopolymer transport system component
MISHAFTRGMAARWFVLLLAFVVAACKGESITDRDPDSVFGTAQVTVKSFGVDLDPDGYVLDVRGVEQHNLPSWGEVDLRVLAGPARLTLRGVAQNCYLAGDSTRTITVGAGSSTQAMFIVTCGSGSQHLAFASTRAGNTDIFVLKEGAASETQITSSLWRDTDPVWSPHSNRLAYATLSPDSATALITIVSAEGDSLATIGSPGTHTEYPAWAPSQDRLAFASDMSGNYELYVVNVNGSGLVRLTNTPENELRPAWSPDGTQLVYDVDVADTSVKRDLFIMNADGSGVRPVITGGKYNFHATWSPDGSSLAFVSQRDGNEEVYVTGVNHASLIRISSNGMDDGSPVWSADGKWVIFQSMRTGVLNVFRRALTGGETEMLTNSPFDDFDPAVSR